MEDSPLNALPAELLNRIYRFVVIIDRPIRLEFSKRRKPHRLTLHSPDNKHEPAGAGVRDMIALTACCRVTRQEAKSIFFGENEFKIDAGIFGRYRQAWLQDCGLSGGGNEEKELCVASTRAWLRSIDPWAKHLRKFTVSVSGNGFHLIRHDIEAVIAIPNLLLELNALFAASQTHCKTFMEYVMHWDQYWSTPGCPLPSIVFRCQDLETAPTAIVKALQDAGKMTFPPNVYDDAQQRESMLRKIREALPLLLVAFEKTDAREFPYDALRCDKGTADGAVLEAARKRVTEWSIDSEDRK